jgi:hypothetical protein
MGLPRMVAVDYLRTWVIFSWHIRRFGFVAVHMFFPDLTAIMRHLDKGDCKYSLLSW